MYTYMYTQIASTDLESSSSSNLLVHHKSYPTEWSGFTWLHVKHDADETFYGNTWLLPDSVWSVTWGESWFIWRLFTGRYLFDCERTSKTSFYQPDHICSFPASILNRTVSRLRPACEKIELFDLSCIFMFYSGEYIGTNLLIHYKAYILSL